MKNFVDKWLATTFMMTIMLAPIELTLNGMSLQSIHAQIRLSQTGVIGSLMYLKKANILEDDEVTIMAHLVLFTLHMISFFNRSVDIFMIMCMSVISFVHSLLSCRKLELDIMMILLFHFGCCCFYDKSWVIPICSSSLPGIIYKCWTRFTMPGVSFQTRKFNYAKLQTYMRGIGLILVIILLVPTIGYDGIKCLLFLLVDLVVEHRVIVPHFQIIFTNGRAEEYGFILAVWTVYSIHLTYLMPGRMDDTVFQLFQMIKMVPSAKLGIHKPGILSIILFFLGDVYEMLGAVMVHNMSIHYKVFIVWVAFHFFSFMMTFLLIMLYEEHEKSKALKEANLQLANHCTLNVSSSDAAISESEEGVSDEDENVCRSGSSESSTSGRDSVRRIRRNDTNALTMNELDRLSKKLARVTDKIEKIAVGDAVSSESSATSTTSNKARQMQMEVKALKKKMAQMVAVIGDRNLGAWEALSELQRQTDQPQSIAYGVPVNRMSAPEETE